MARSVKKAKRVRVEGTDTRFEIQYVVDSVDVKLNQGASEKGWIDPDGMPVEDIGNHKFRRTSDGAVLIAEE